jgi:hypothetical protein
VQFVLRVKSPALGPVIEKENPLIAGAPAFERLTVSGELAAPGPCGEKTSSNWSAKSVLAAFA